MRKCIRLLKTIITFLIIIVGITSFTNSTNYRIVIGIGYGDLPCNGLTVSTAKAYQYMYAIDGNISQMEKRIKDTLLQNRNVNPQKIVFKYGYASPYAVIIRYNEHVSGWGCDKIIYGAGFGNSPAEAEQDAIKNKENRNPHTIIQNISFF